MKIMTDETTVQHQYDALIKNVLKNEARSYLRELKRRADEDAKLADRLGIVSSIKIDKYTCECVCFQVGHRKIYLEDEELGNAIHKLSYKQQVIILLFYFENMSDEEISRELHLDRSTIFRNRKQALNKIKSNMEGMHHVFI